MRLRAALRAVTFALFALLAVAGTALAQDAGADPAAAAEAVAKAASEGTAHGFAMGWVIPFAGLLLSIAILPLVAHHWWEQNRNRAIIAGGWALPVLILLLGEGEHGLHLLGHAGMEYVAFIALLGSLYVISGGILVTGDIRATPLNNVGILAIGAVLANLIGTTGASMLLIRPILRINSERKNTLHVVVFFIFIVSNCGGCLTPLGDPPLFLGYLRGVPFEWTLVLWKEWAFVCGMLLVIFFIFDTLKYRQETPAAVKHDDTEIEPIRVRGNFNFLLLGGVIASVLFLHEGPREVAMILLAVVSIFATKAELRKANGFNFEPINEVAILFAGIFVAMIPALEILRAHGSEMGLSQPWHFFVATGGLSSFLDNAPTYLTFFSVAQGMFTDLPAGMAGVELIGSNPTYIFPEPYLIAISLGAVFMGANTYIGNGPNFMVKAIAESAGQKMPSFFGYFGWALVFLAPLLTLTAVLFLL